MIFLKKFQEKLDRFQNFANNKNINMELFYTNFEKKNNTVEKPLLNYKYERGFQYYNKTEIYLKIT